MNMALLSMHRSDESSLRKLVTSASIILRKLFEVLVVEVTGIEPVRVDLVRVTLATCYPHCQALKEVPNFITESVEPDTGGFDDCLYCLLEKHLAHVASALTD